MIRPNRAHTPVFPDRNYRVWKAVRAHNSLDHGLFSVEMYISREFPFAQILYIILFQITFFPLISLNLRKKLREDFKRIQKQNNLVNCYYNFFSQMDLFHKKQGQLMLKSTRSVLDKDFTSDNERRIVQFN